MSDTTDIDRLVRVHLKIRAARSALSKKFNEEDDKLKAQQERVENELLRFLNDNNMKNSKTESGTFYWQKEIQPVGSDWDRFYSWVKENDAFDALERRIKKGFVTEYMEEHDGDLPPGVSVNTKRVVRVRRA